MAIVEQARRFAQEELTPRAAKESESESLRDVLGRLAELGYLGMPYPKEAGGSGQPYGVYLQALEEIGGAWTAVGLGLSVHIASCYPLATRGTRAQSERWLGDMLAGGQPKASIAKLLATDAAMRVTTDAVQVHGARGYTKDFPVERQMRDAKALQILEGTNQIQRMVIARDLARA